MRPILSLVMLLALVVVGCATTGDDAEDSLSQEARNVCYSSDDCGNGKYCTTEDGVCNSPCRPNQTCIQVCTGTCKKDNRQSTCDYNNPERTYYGTDADTCAVIRFACADGQVPFFDDCGCGCETAAGEACGSTTCGAGEVCCNASCGICTPPGGACIQIACL
jgi:hypothetical protein